MMNKEEQSAECKLFDYETSYRTDYRDGEIREYPKTVYKERPSRYRRATPTYKSTHSMIQWKEQKPPFNIFHAPKDVVKTNPNHVQRRFDKPVDHQRGDIQKTRPRLVMTPAVSLDDIDDPSARKIIIADMYTTDNQRNMRMPVLSTANDDQKAPLPGLPAPSNPIVLPKLQPPYVSPEWRMDSVTWDSRQLRSYCNPTQRFWLTQELPKCQMCEETAVVLDHRRMLKGLKQGKR